MMKTIYRFLFYACALLAAVSTASCIRGGDTFTEDISITFTSGIVPEAQVKGTPAAGDDDYNENLLNSVYYFFYPKDAADVTPSVSGFKTGISETGTYTVKIPVSTNTIVNDLFASDNECQLFAVANPPAGLVPALEGKPTLAALRAMVVASSFTKVPQDNFTLVYDGPVAVASRSAQISVNAVVEMKHLAAKFTVGAIVIPSLKPNEAETYTPQALSVKLCNGINKTTLGGWNKSKVQDGDYFSTDFIGMTDMGTVTIESADYKKFVCDDPIYSYPMEWELNSETEPYLMYEVYWKITNSSEDVSYKNLYYKLNLGRRSIMENEWYDISAKLTVLGSLYPEEPTQIYYYMDYLVNGWKGDLDDDDIHTSAEIKDSRYLAVNQTEWVLNNKNEVTIPFSSSHECEAVNKSITTTSYSTGTAQSKNPHFPDVTYDLTTPNEITVTHNIYNTLGSGMDCAPIIIEFDLRHKSTDPIIQQTFTEHIKITQNPAITIKTFANSGGRSSSNDYGYTYVNNAQSGNWQIVLGANASGNNSSIYLTVITVSQFDPSTGFIVGDPRDPQQYNNLDKNTSTEGVQWNAVNPVSAPAKYKGDGQTGNRTIKYYHPTIDDGSRDNFVAPSIRVNSANCRSGQNETYENAVQRCAAYQEDGYPAGRWRLPTLAECKLIQTMSSNGIVPTIFIQNSTSYYCYAGGWFAGNASQDSHYHPYSAGYSKTTSDGGSGGGAARCVYDEWYWSEVDKKMGWNNSDKTTFTWGDVPDDFVIPTTTP